jgi:branched-chain amino acid transport system substrate-binding protein
MCAHARRSTGLLTFCLSVLLVLSSCSPASSTIRIYVSLPLETRQGQSIRNGIELALREAEWRAGGFRVELLIQTDSLSSGYWDGALEEANAREAVADADVMAYIGPMNSGAAAVSIPITNRGGLAQISPSNTAPELTKVGFTPGLPGEYYPTGQRNYFRLCTTDDWQGAAGAIWARQMNFSSVYILDDGEVYGLRVADFFEEKAVDVGIQVLGRETIDKTAGTFQDVLQRVANAGPDLVFFGGSTTNGAPLIAHEIHEMQVGATLMVPDGAVDSEFIEDAGAAAAEGVLGTLVGLPPRELTGKGAEFYQAYMKVYEEEPEPFAQFGYDAARVVLEAIERAGAKNRQAILDAIAALRNFEGTGGRFSFDRNGDTTLIVLSGNRVEQGRFEFVQLLKPLR